MRISDWSSYVCSSDLMNAEDLHREYLNMRDAYVRIFTRLGANFRAVKADSGNIGGALSEEFHILAGSGEDCLAVAEGGTYAANVEAAETLPSGQPRVAASAAMTKVSTPGQKTCEQVSKFLNVPLTGKVKLLIVKGAAGGLVGIALRGAPTLKTRKEGNNPKDP